jgi:hypothetical protein
MSFKKPGNYIVFSRLISETRPNLWLTLILKALPKWEMLDSMMTMEPFSLKAELTISSGNIKLSQFSVVGKIVNNNETV